MRSRDKNRLFWDFYRSEWARGTSLYAQTDVRRLRESKRHSIEHIVPRSMLKDALLSRSRRLCNGATCNPLNMAAVHRRLNRARGSAEFDFEMDPVIRPVGRGRRRGRRQVVLGFDYQGEWVVPPARQGEIARVILYMAFVYGLPWSTLPRVERLRDWARADRPSKDEKAFSTWTRARWRIGNPLVEDASRIEDQELFAKTGRG